ncbi:MAG: GDP-mannose 4,6-dehydratase, partial [Bacteroidales bacterium]|nr:GDP-mannose 4,6-dehydratase [Bacteroidales bacterium]
MEDNKNSVWKWRSISEILISGGCGFIGSHVVRHFVKHYPQYRIINVDKLTYAANPDHLKDIENEPNYVFIQADVCNHAKME